MTHPLPEALVQLIAQRFRVLSEPTRIKLLDRLREGESSVQELTELIGSSQQNVSKHLGVLHEAMRPVLVVRGEKAHELALARSA